MTRWGEIKCPRCAELKDRLNYAVGEREDYEKIIKQLQAERLANRVAIMRLEAKLAKAVEALRGWIDFAHKEGMPVLLSDLEAAELTSSEAATKEGGKDE